MIHAIFFRDSGSRLRGFHIDGHAGDAAYGYDIVCAGVSSAVELASNLVTDFFKLDAKASLKSDAVMLKIQCDTSGTGDMVLLGLANHLEYIADCYPGRMKIEIKDTEDFC